MLDQPRQAAARDAEAVAGILRVRARTVMAVPGSCPGTESFIRRSDRKISPPQSALEGRLPRVNIVLEIREILPRGLRRFTAGSWRIDRRFDQLHGWDVTRTVGKDCP